MQKRLIAISDISCVGKCSLMTAVPILSALGHECAVLPTSVLSVHTAVFPEYTFSDLTPQMRDIIAHFAQRQVTFDGILTGYLTGPEQSAVIESFLSSFSRPGAPVVVDPILGDHGRLYRGFTNEHVTAAASLCRKADYILPNLTEAALLLGQPPWDDSVPCSLEKAKTLAAGLTALGVNRVIITGIPLDKEIGVVGYDAAVDSYFYHFTPLEQGIFHGTGDIFAAAFFGALCHGIDWTVAAAAGADFTAECVAATAKDPHAKAYGTNFEQCLQKPVFRRLIGSSNT